MASTIIDALRSAEPRPPSTASAAAKKNYAERLSRSLAQKVANSLRKDFPGTLPDEGGGGQESKARTAKGFKKLDINYSTPQLGLGLGVSIKTLNFRDARSKRYTKNFTRIDNELRAEAVDYHTRQPYSVLAAIVFLPIDSCDDGKANSRAGSAARTSTPRKDIPSSFGHAVYVFRFRTGRADPKNAPELFERLFIGLYEPGGPHAGNTISFDAMTPPPKTGRPRKGLLTYSQVLEEIRKVYDRRNESTFEWEEGAETVPDLASEEGTADEDEE